MITSLYGERTSSMYIGYYLTVKIVRINSPDITIGRDLYDFFTERGENT